MVAETDAARRHPDPQRHHPHDERRLGRRSWRRVDRGRPHRLDRAGARDGAYARDRCSGRVSAPGLRSNAHPPVSDAVPRIRRRSQV